MQLEIGTQSALEARKNQTETSVSLYALAKDALAANDNSADAAEEYLIDLLSSNPSLLRSVVRGAVKTAVSENVTRVLSDQRRVTFDSAAAARANKARSVGLAQAIKSTLLSTPLSDGTLLKDATKNEIVETADRWQKQATTQAHRARWLLAVADAIPAGRRCGDVLSEEKALELYRNAA